MVKKIQLKKCFLIKNIMVRIKRGNVARKRRHKILQQAKGFKGAHSRLFRVANQQVMKANKYAYRGRKEKKRYFRKLWITRINGILIQEKTNLKYSKFMNILKKQNIQLNRKIISQLGIYDKQTFKKLIN